MAEEVARHVGRLVQPDQPAAKLFPMPRRMTNVDTFPGLQEKFPAIDWCVQHEFCCTLEDYLRRRTNISQWLPREGFGFQDENRAYLLSLAQRLPAFPGKTPDHHVKEYAAKVSERFDRVMAQI